MTKTNREGLSVVVPTLNEEGNIKKLVKRIDKALADFAYEIIFVDDHSTDKTQLTIKSLAEEYPISLRLKKGRRGKAHSLIEGFALAKYDFIAMIDADLQYPPEALPKMIKKLQNNEADIVVANRIERRSTKIRSFFSKGFMWFFGAFLHGLHLDVQSGLKVFRSKILREISLHPSPWTIDLELLVKARNVGYEIGSADIAFDARTEGKSKINIAQAVYEIGTHALKLKYQRKTPTHIPSHDASSMLGSGIAHQRKRFITHTTLPHHISAVVTFTRWQKLFFFAVVGVLVAGFFVAPLETAIAGMAVLSAIYFFDVLFNFFLISKSLHQPPEISFSSEQLAAIDETVLPLYSILCPLYKEAHILPTFLDAIAKLDWPKEKLDVILLLEEDDQQTIKAAEKLGLPSYVRVVVVPHSFPKTKPKACNYGLSIAKGEYLVIYDAEDIPEPEQLKKAYLGFAESPENVKCLQAKLNYHNPHQNFLTRLFTAEYSLWFDVILTGLQSINTTIPLGGTSNHFRTKDLLDLEGWDPFNVTEDCDLGVRLFKRGFNTAIIDSTTLEEANSDLKNWLRQRSRWIKGYMQTYLVHMRNPFRFFRENGGHALVFQLNVGGKIAFLLINPLLWLATISYFTLYAIVGPTIEKLFPTVVFYMAAFSLIFGNFLYLYYYMIGCAKRGHWQLVKYVFFVPIYWFFASMAAVLALYQLFAKPHFWEKTHHGLHLKKTGTKSASLVPPEPVVPKVEPVAQNSWRLSSLWFIPKSFTMFFRGSLPEHVLQGAGFLIASMMVANALNFLFNAFLGRTLDFEELGLVVLVNTLWMVAGIFISAVGAATNHKVSYLIAAEGVGAGSSFLRSSLSKAIGISLLFATLWIGASPQISSFFQIANVLVLINFTPMIFFGILLSVNRGFLSGNLFFIRAGILLLVESAVKLAVAVAFSVAGFNDLVYLSIPFSVAVTAILSFYFIFRNVERAAPASIHKFPVGFYGAALIANISATVFLTLDILLVKHFLDPVAAGQYALLALIGKIIYFLGELPNVFMITLVSRDEGLRQDSKKSFWLIFGSSATLTLIGFLLIGPLGFLVAPLLFGQKVIDVLPFLNAYAVAIAMFTIANSIVTYHLAKKTYVFPLISLVFPVLMAAGIAFNHETLHEVVEVMLTVSALFLTATVALHALQSQFPFVARAFRDFQEAFAAFSVKTPIVARGKKRILIFNWRDTKHIFAGGAEIYIHEIAKRWVREGNSVTLFCGNDGKSPRQEVIDGIQIIRRGGFYFVYLWAFLYYVRKFRKKFDVIVDCHNGIPFFTPLYAREPVFCLIHHVHQEVFRHSLSTPLSFIARFLEKDLMPIIYANTPMITVSESSKSDILHLGMGQKGIEIVHPGIDLRRFIVGQKSESPMVLYLGRLKAYKSIDVLIRAFRIVADKNAEARLIIAGSGEENGRLKKLAASLGLSSRVKFAGRVSEDDKLKLLQKAWVMVNPSFFEGWGITTIEANACGTPVVASDVAGLRDSVRNPATGFLVPHGNEKAFAEKILELLEHRTLREAMEAETVLWAKHFDWETSSEKFITILGETEKRANI